MFGFGSKPQNTQQQQQQPNTQQQMPNNQQQANQPQNNGMPGQPGNNQNAQSNQPANPLDTYSKMFDNAPTDGDTAPTFSIDPKVMDQVVSGQDFTQGIDAELMQKATSGDTQALLQVIQHVGRNSYRAAIEHGGVLTDKFVGARESFKDKGFGSRIKQELTSAELAKTPNFQHPVVRQQLTEVAQRLQRQHPDAQPGEIAKMAKDYITQLSQALNPEDKAAANNGQNSEVRGEDYWNNFFSEGQDN